MFSVTSLCPLWFSFQSENAAERWTSMKRCESSGRCGICTEVFAHSRRRRRRSILPITAVAAAGAFPHIPRARGGGRSPSRHEVDEPGQMQRESLKHLFGITDQAASHEEKIRRMPPFKTASVADGGALMFSVGVIRKVVTSSSTLARYRFNRKYAGSLQSSHTPLDHAAVR